MIMTSSLNVATILHFSFAFSFSPSFSSRWIIFIKFILMKTEEQTIRSEYERETWNAWHAWAVRHSHFIGTKPFPIIFLSRQDGAWSSSRREGQGGLWVFFSGQAVLHRCTLALEFLIFLALFFLFSFLSLHFLFGSSRSPDAPWQRRASVHSLLVRRSRNWPPLNSQRLSFAMRISISQP